MKANDPHHWLITLSGKTARKCSVFTGTLDEALSEADVMESSVRFAVTEFKITRGKCTTKTAAKR